SSQCGDLPGGRERLAGATPLHARDGAKSVSPRFAIPARTRIARFLSGFARPLAAAWRGRWRRWGWDRRRRWWWWWWDRRRWRGGRWWGRRRWRWWWWWWRDRRRWTWWWWWDRRRWRRHEGWRRGQCRRPGRFLLKLSRRRFSVQQPDVCPIES